MLRTLLVLSRKNFDSKHYLSFLRILFLYEKKHTLLTLRKLKIKYKFSETIV